MKKLMNRIWILPLIAVLLCQQVGFAAVGIEDHVQSYVLGDYETGEILESFQADTPKPMASISKLMTYYVVMDQLKAGTLQLEDTVTITKEMEEVPGSNFGLVTGEVLTVKSLLEGLMVVSGNDAAYALAVKISGSEPAFVELMNQKAKSLGLEKAMFYNASGLQQGEHQNTMTTEEIFKMSQSLMSDYPEVLAYSNIRSIHMPERNYSAESTIPLVGEMMGVDGLKTGFTDEAGYCLVSTIDVSKTGNGGEFRLIGVVMGTHSIEARKEYTRQLLQYGLDHYSIRTIVDANVPIETITVPAAKIPTVPVYATESLRMLSKREKRYILETNFEPFKAPLKSGDIVGTLTVSDGPNQLTEMDLVLKNDVPKANFFTRLFRAVENTFEKLEMMLN